MNDRMDGQQDDAAMPMPAGGGGSPSLEADERHHRPDQPAEGADSEEGMNDDMGGGMDEDMDETMGGGTGGGMGGGQV